MILTAKIMVASISAMVMMMVVVMPLAAKAYAQPILDLEDTPTISERIETAETNTEIDIQQIDEILQQVSTEYIPALYQAAVEYDDNAFSENNNQIDDLMWDIRLAVSYVTPEQVTLTNVVENVSVPSNDTMLNVTLIDDSASRVQELTGYIFGRYTSQFSTLTENDAQAMTDRMQYHVKNMRNELGFSLPPEQVRLIGGMSVTIDELRALEAELNPPSTLVLP
jgi:hypothetical protein